MYASIVCIFKKQRMIWLQMSIVLRLRRPTLMSLLHALAVHISQLLSSYICLPLLLQRKFPGGRDYGLVKWNEKESNMCWINEQTSHRSLLSQITHEASWEGWWERDGKSQCIHVKRWQVSISPYWKKFHTRDLDWLPLAILKDRGYMSTCTEHWPCGQHCVLQALTQWGPHKDPMQGKH